MSLTSKKDKNDNSKAAVVVNKKREVLPDKIVLHQATTSNIIQLKNFLMERLTKNQVKYYSFNTVPFYSYFKTSTTVKSPEFGPNLYHYLS